MQDETCFISLYGNYLEGSQPSNDDIDADAYSLFVSRATSFGWRSITTQTSSPTLWGMNDASSEWGVEGNLAWFQVSLCDTDDKLISLPVLPLLQCATDVVERVGSASLTGVQLYLPVHLSRNNASDLATMRTWFSRANPHRSADIIVTVDSGDSDALGLRRNSIANSLGGVLLEGVAKDLQLLETDTWVAQSPTPIVPIWIDRDHSRVSFAMTLAEWTTASVAYVSAAIVEACRSAGVDCSVAIDIVRS